MGYCMNKRESLFNIRPENQGPALKAIKSLADKETITDGSGHHFSWVDTKDFLFARTLDAAMRAWRWQLERVDDEICDIYFEGSKLGDDELLFQTIAPYVEPGSYIEMQGEDGLIWRWCFDGKTCTEKTAKIIWEDEEE